LALIGTLTDGDIDANAMHHEQLQASLLSMGAEHCEVYIDPLMNPKCTVWDIVDEYLTRLLRETLSCRRPGQERRRQSRQVLVIQVHPDGCTTTMEVQRWTGSRLDTDHQIRWKT
jgi:hypothetical protein